MTNKMLALVMRKVAASREGAYPKIQFSKV